MYLSSPNLFDISLIRHNKILFQHLIVQNKLQLFLDKTIDYIIKRHFTIKSLYTPSVHRALGFEHFQELFPSFHLPFPLLTRPTITALIITKVRQGQLVRIFVIFSLFQKHSLLRAHGKNKNLQTKKFRNIKCIISLSIVKEIQ